MISGVDEPDLASAMAYRRRSVDVLKVVVYRLLCLPGFNAPFDGLLHQSFGRLTASLGHCTRRTIPIRLSVTWKCSSLMLPRRVVSSNKVLGKEAGDGVKRL